MPRTLRGQRRRIRVGSVSVYLHHGGWCVYYREHGRPVRRRVADDVSDAKKVAAQINAQLASSSPTLLSFQPVKIDVLRNEFLNYHETVLASSIATVGRYRTATLHLERFFEARSPRAMCHELNVAGFVGYLRSILVAPNGHHNSEKRHLREKGIEFIVETCRAMYHFAARHRHLPPYAENPFVEAHLKLLKIRDAKPVFVFDSESELAFFRAADSWEFPLHFFLAKTGVRVGEAAHTLIEDIDLERRWLRVSNKPELGWRIKTGTERSVPLLPELVALLKSIIGNRTCGPLFLRRRFQHTSPSLNGPRKVLKEEYERRLTGAGAPLSRIQSLRIADSIWRDAGAIDSDQVRLCFIRVMRRLNNTDATCPKSWRHSFATLLQDANVDPLVRQVTLGHRSQLSNGLGMTANYTHTRPETQRVQIEGALRLWPASLAMVEHFLKGVQG